MNFFILVWISMLLFAGCDQRAQEENSQPPSASPLAGTAWQMDYSMEIKSDTTFDHVPSDWVRIKTFTKNRWTFTGYDFGKKKLAGMGGGTYALKGNTYVENIEFHHHSDFNGKRFVAELRFDSLYLYQKGRVDSLILEERWHRID